MKKISEARRESLKKMSDVRLSNILLQLGYTLEQLEAMDRSGMLNAYAELILAGKDKPPAVTAAVVAMSGMAMVVADPEVQKQLVQLEMAKLEEARRGREEQMRLAKESLDWERRFKAEELELRKQELVRQQEKDRLKAERFGATMGARMTPYADAFRNAAFRSRHESMDVLTFFENCDRIFEDANFIRTQLIRPFLSDQAKEFLSQLDPAKAAEYKDLKQYTLDELKLNPAAYMEMFNYVKRTDNETCAVFVSKLRTLLGRYVQSRHAEGSYEKLFSLFICDRVKATLPERCLRHVLAVESNTKQGWLDTNELADQVDSYLSNLFSDTPQVTTTICAPTQSAASRNVVTSDNCNKATVSNTSNAGAGCTSGNTETTKAGSSTNSCCRCHSTEHRLAACPLEPSQHQLDDRCDRTDARMNESVSTPASPTAVKSSAAPRTPVRNGSMTVKTNSPAVIEDGDDYFADSRAMSAAAVNACISLPYFPG